MSVICPRAERPYFTCKFKKEIPKYIVRHQVETSITGWAHVNGWRGPTDEDYKIIKRVEFDLWYIENWTFWLDMKIIFMTLFSKQSKLNAF